MRSVVIGAVESTAVLIRKLVEFDYKPVLVVTLGLEYANRHSDFVDIRPLCNRYNIKILEVNKSQGSEFIAKIRAERPDYLWVVGWSQIIAHDILAVPRYGVIGYHPAPLPKMRGRAVIAWTILRRMRETASSVFFINEDVDAGDIIQQEFFSVSDEENVATLLQKHMLAFNLILERVIPSLAKNEVMRYPQDHAHATYCARRRPEDGLIDWNASANDIACLIRSATRPYPGAFSFYHNKKVFIWSAQILKSNPHIAMPGQVVGINQDYLDVYCGRDSLLRLTQVSFEREILKEVGCLFKLHDKFATS